MEVWGPPLEVEAEVETATPVVTLAVDPVAVELAPVEEVLVGTL